jgi:hypothetical protein
LNVSTRHGRRFRARQIRATVEAHDRIVPGSIDQHLETIATYWTECCDHGQSLAITTTRNEHVDLINDHIQAERWERGELDRSRRADTADGIGAWSATSCPPAATTARSSPRPASSSATATSGS